MWPTALQMTRDECRGILRRLELESYSNVISVFRAQGGLSDSKAKLLEELRSIFHISQERHRAEARRVANDEQLSTIAEAISGPNTWQEWSREGRRSFPLLPRIPPQTALSLIANNVATEVTNENIKLPYPADTAIADHELLSSCDAAADEKNPPIVTTDPNQPPEVTISTIKSALGYQKTSKKSLKRNLPDNQTRAINSTKKRIVFSTSPHTVAAANSEEPVEDTAEPILSPSSTSIRKLYHNHSKTQSKIKSVKKNATAALAAQKRSSAAKSKKSNQQQQQQQKQKEDQQADQPPTLAQSQLTADEAILSDKTKPLPVPLSLQQQASQLPAPVVAITTPVSSEHDNKIQLLPQVATSKKDISKNLTKLNISQSLHDKASTVQSPPCQLPTFSTPPTQTPPSSSLPNPSLLPKTEKPLISTPVQKYIVEDRQPPQAMSIPQFTAAASKLRTMNTTLLPPGATISTAKLQGLKTLKSNSVLEQCSMPVTSQPQVFNVIEAQQAASSSNLTPYVISAPPHTPPAIIQLNSNKLHDPPEHGKVLTTKLVPLMLSTAVGIGGSKLDSLNGSGHIKNITNAPASIQSPNSSVFRKPNIIKGGIISALTTKQPHTVIGSSSGIPNNNQLISNIKMPLQLQHLKNSATTTTTTFTATATSTAIVSRKNVKIFSSPNGQMFIQSANGTKTPGKLSTHHISLQKTLSTRATSNRVAIQKVQIIPAPLSSPGTIGIPNNPHQSQKQQTIAISSKSNVIFMPPQSASTISQPGSIVRNLALAKNNKQQITSPSSSINTPTVDVGKQNVFVIGAVPQPQQQSAKSIKAVSVLNESNMITEDTPVDILNMPIIVADSTDGSCSSFKSKNALSDAGVKIESVTVLQTRLPIHGMNNNTMKSPLDGSCRLVQSTDDGTTTTGESSMEIVLGVTDWEMELDQEAANKAKADQKKIMTKAYRNQKSCDKFNVIAGLCSNSVAGQFNDVIEEEISVDVGGREDEQLECDNDDDGSNVQNIQGEEDEEEHVLDIVLADEQEQPQQQLLQNTSNSERTQLQRQSFHHNDGVETIEVNDDSHHDGTMVMKGTSESEFIQFDETYESADMDDNIAIEYVEEDQDIIESYKNKIQKTRLPMVSSTPRQTHSDTNTVDNIHVKSSSISSGNNNTATNCIAGKIQLSASQLKSTGASSVVEASQVAISDGKKVQQQQT